MLIPTGVVGDGTVSKDESTESGALLVMLRLVGLSCCTTGDGVSTISTVAAAGAGTGSGFSAAAVTSDAFAAAAIEIVLLGLSKRNSCPCSLTCAERFCLAALREDFLPAFSSSSSSSPLEERLLLEAIQGWVRHWSAVERFLEVYKMWIR